MRPRRAGSITHFCDLRSATPGPSTSGVLKPNQRLSASSIDFLPDGPFQFGGDVADAIETARGGRVRQVGAVDEELQGVVDDQRILLGFAVALEDAADGGNVRQF